MRTPKMFAQTMADAAPPPPGGAGPTLIRLAAARFALAGLTVAGLMVASLMVTGCVAPLLIGGVTTVAVKATEDRGLGGALSDTGIHAQVNELWFKHDLDLYNRINLSVDQGRVLLTGRAANEQMRADAERLVRQVPGITELFNDIVIDNQTNAWDSTQDSWIATQLRTVLLTDGAVISANYSIDVVNGMVYLLGVAHSQEELDRVVGHAKAVDRVQGVVSHVRLG